MTLVERIRDYFTVYNERGPEAIDGFVHPDCVYQEAADFPGSDVHRGKEAVRARFAEYMDILGDVQSELLRGEERGDRAAWSVRYVGRTREGVPHESSWGYIGRFEDGLAIDVRAYYQPERAFEALESEANLTDR